MSKRANAGMSAGTVTKLNRVIVFLAIALAFISVVGGVALLATTRPAPVEPVASALQAEELTLQQSVAALGGVIVERPLFWESRRPEAPLTEDVVEEAPQQRGPSAIAEMKLKGVFVSSTSVGAIVELNGERRRVEYNSAIEGWVLSDIQPTGATFMRLGSDGEIEEQHFQLEHSQPSSDTEQASRERFAPATESVSNEELSEESVAGDDEQVQ